MGCAVITDEAKNKFFTSFMFHSLNLVLTCACIGKFSLQFISLHSLLLHCIAEAVSTLGIVLSG